MRTLGTASTTHAPTHPRAHALIGRTADRPNHHPPPTTSTEPTASQISEIEHEYELASPFASLINGNGGKEPNGSNGINGSNGLNGTKSIFSDGADEAPVPANVTLGARLAFVQTPQYMRDNESMQLHVS